MSAHGDDAPWARARVDGARLFARCRAEAEQLAEHVAHARADGARAEHAAELVLAWAAGHGDPTALRALAALVADEPAQAARRIDTSPGFVDEVVQQVWLRLATADRGPPRLLSYRGGGPLRAWVAIAALRTALNLRRGQRQHDPLEVVAELAAPATHPASDDLRRRYQAEFRAAVRAALAALPAAERAVLRLRFVEGLDLPTLGRLYGVHPSTMSRRLGAIAAGLGQAARADLTARLGLGDHTVDSVARLLASQLDLSITRLL
ncbi:MAG: sigma-70 family RNA polymerase sigma factor [Kofleriaceae bacterium]|jgi:RNA polymerase sigma-70 factor (ECF subfamily)|nr:sigma-70 family RNA polymerase sigma factor [Kofleriaceae bacterium]